MKPSIQTLGHILYSPSQYVIPVFQRNYRWETPQWAKLWESLIEIQRPGKRGNHFMGFLVFVPGLAQPGQHTSFHLIDGQQRLTTSSILLAAVRNVARHMNQPDLADEIHQYLPVVETPPSWTIRLPSGVRHIGVELRFNLRRRHAGIDLWFWRDASRPIWERIRESPEWYNELVQGEWSFEPVDGRQRARMFVSQSVSDLRDELVWPDLYRWLGERLSLVYEKVVPKLREEIDRIEATS